MNSGIQTHIRPLKKKKKIALNALIAKQTDTSQHIISYYTHLLILCAANKNQQTAPIWIYSYVLLWFYDHASFKMSATLQLEEDNVQGRFGC